MRERLYAFEQITRDCEGMVEAVGRFWGLLVENEISSCDIYMGSLDDETVRRAFNIEDFFILAKET